MKHHIQKLKHELGLTLIELTVVLAISGLIALPLARIIGSPLRIPQKLPTKFTSPVALVWGSRP